MIFRMLHLSTKSRDQRILLGKYEVTQAQYEAVMTGNSETYATPSNFAGNPNRPSMQRVVVPGMIFRYSFTFECTGGRQYPRGWTWYCPPKRSGSMPAGQARPRRTRGDSITTDNANYSKDIPTRDVGWYDTPGAF